MSRRVRCYVIIILCALLLAAALMSCRKSPATPTPVAPIAPPATPTQAGAAAPTPEPTPAPMPARTPTVGTVDPGALLAYIPDSAEVVGALRAELDGDAEREVVALLGMERRTNGLGYGYLELMVLELERAPAGVVAWRSGRLVGERGEGLQVRDINGDGRDEVLSYQSMGAAGYTLYVLGWQDGACGLLRPRGGYFEGQDHFGDVGVRLEDLDRDSVPEILASYGPAGSSTDVYKWDGTAFAFGITLLDK